MPETHYFSVVSISDSGMKSSYLRQQCSDIYGVHQEIWKLFPSKPDQKRDFIFRTVLNPQQQEKVIEYGLTPKKRFLLWTLNMHT